MSNQSLAQRGFWPILVGALLIAWGLIVSVGNLANGQILYALIGAAVLIGFGALALTVGIRKWRATT